MHYRFCSNRYHLTLILILVFFAKGDDLILDRDRNTCHGDEIGENNRCIVKGEKNDEATSLSNQKDDVGDDYSFLDSENVVEEVEFDSDDWEDEDEDEYDYDDYDDEEEEDDDDEFDEYEYEYDEEDDDDHDEELEEYEYVYDDEDEDDDDDEEDKLDEYNDDEEEEEEDDENDYEYDDEEDDYDEEIEDKSYQENETESNKEEIPNDTKGSKKACIDNHDRCPFWAGTGECEANPNYMLASCQKSCGFCSATCNDDHENCRVWADEGECIANPDYMHRHCQHSCNICIGDSHPCIDRNDQCSEWTRQGTCDTNPNFMHRHCPKSCGICFNNTAIDMGVYQFLPPQNPEPYLDIIRLSRDYLFRDILSNTTFANIVSGCKNYNNDCVHWASIGKCEKEGEGFMRMTCPLACCACHLLEFSVRCPLDLGEREALKPGDLNRMFERILTDERYDPKVLSRPSSPNAQQQEQHETNYRIGPWIIQLESFLSPRECQHLIALGSKLGYTRSFGVGKLHQDGTRERILTDTRTSETAWCIRDCHDDVIVQRILKRIQNMTGGIPQRNQEYLQLLKYDVHQYYKSHHDYIPVDARIYPAGPRVLTVYLYLNDVEKGGGTMFNDLGGLTVMPKQGRAVVWPSVLDEDLTMREDRTHHEALEVEEGVKYGANVWIHLRDFKTQYKKGCI